MKSMADPLDLPQLRNSFAPLDRSPEVFSWDPI